MWKRRAPFLASALVCLSFAGMARAEPKVRLAVLELTEKDAGGWSGHVGRAAEDWFVDSLVNTRKFSVVERQQLNSILAEHAFQLSGSVDQATAVKAGRMAGVQFVVFGNIDFAQKEQGVHSGGLGSLLGKALPWGSGSRKVSEGNLTARAVNIRTGEIVFSKSETVTASNFNISIMGTGGGTAWDETVVRKTFQPAVERITSEMVAKLGTLTESLGDSATGVEGKVVLLKDGLVFVNLGKLDGVKPGDKYQVVRAEIIRDPDSNQELGRDEKVLGELTVEKVAGEHLCAGRPSAAGFEKGDLVRRK
jgi:curli biogenesis system outer membrane secretion channel CsgG